jgi:hypothetical protein
MPELREFIQQDHTGEPRDGKDVGGSSVSAPVIAGRRAAGEGRLPSVPALIPGILQMALFGRRQVDVKEPQAGALTLQPESRLCKVGRWSDLPGRVDSPSPILAWLSGAPALPATPAARSLRPARLYKSDPACPDGSRSTCRRRVCGGCFDGRLRAAPAGSGTGGAPARA